MVAKMTDAELTEFIQASRLHGDASAPVPMPCGHPRGCLVRVPCPDCAGTGAQIVNTGSMPEHGNLEQESCDKCAGVGHTDRCAWCEEVARLREELKRAASARKAIWSVPVKIHGTPCDKCGGTDYQCAECLENVAKIDAGWKLREKAERLRGELERLRGDDGHPHESGDECIRCERLATERGWPWCNQCFLETQLQYCDDFATTAQVEMERSWKEIERLRELIPDAGMLDWLVKAAHRWWKDNGGKGTQKDIEAGYALVRELYRETNLVDRLREKEEADIDET